MRVRHVFSVTINSHADKVCRGTFPRQVGGRDAIVQGEPKPLVYSSTRIEQVEKELENVNDVALACHVRADEHVDWPQFEFEVPQALEVPDLETSDHCYVLTSNRIPTLFPPAIPTISPPPLKPPRALARRADRTCRAKRGQWAPV